MWFVVIGTLLTLIKALDVALAETSWFLVLSPFAAAIVWWWWADATGYTKRKAMQRDDERKRERRRKNMEALGMDARLPPKRK
jgi:small Trp-rich protein